MSNNKELKEKIDKLISEGKTKESIDYLLQNLDKNQKEYRIALQLSSRYESLMNKTLKGIISSGEETLELNKINNSILQSAEGIGVEVLIGTHNFKYTIPFFIVMLFCGFYFIPKYFIQTDVPAKITEEVKPEPIEICSCMCGDGLAGNKFWGPKGEYGCGNARYGKYENDCRKLTKIGSGSAKYGGMQSFIVWGPIGEPILGNPDFGKYGEVEVRVSKEKVGLPAVLSYCKGAAHYKSGFLGLEFWGPKGYKCLGVATWDRYDSGQNCFD